jgi:hypothetical protein
LTFQRLESPPSSKPECRADRVTIGGCHDIIVRNSRGAGQANLWEDWTNLVLGLWLIASPWALQFTGDPATAWNAWISGGIIAIIAAAALYQVQKWEEWSNVIVGIWVASSPWVLGFSNNPVTTWNAVIVGLLVLCVAGWELYALPAETRMQH